MIIVLLLLLFLGVYMYFDGIRRKIIKPIIKPTIKPTINQKIETSVDMPLVQSVYDVEYIYVNSSVTNVNSFLFDVTTTKNLNGSKYFGGYPKNNLILNGSYELDYDLTVTGTLGGIDTIRLVDENDSAGSARYFVITGAGGNYKYRNIITVNLFNAQILFSGSIGEIANGYIRLKKVNKTFI